MKLSHEKYMDEALSRVSALEAEVDALQEARVRNRQELGVASISEKPNVKPSRWWW